MDDLINLAILEELENEIHRDEFNIQRRVLRDHSDPFQIPDEIFLKYYRFSQDSARGIIELIRPHLLANQRVTAVPVELKILTMLYFLGHGSYQKCVGMNLNLSLEQSTVSRIINETTNCMVNHIMNQFIKFPNSVVEQNILKEQFYEKFNFPGVLGAVDCTHIGIIAPDTEDPVRPGLVYYNRKGYYSINVQMVCDSNLNIINCNARFPGSVHDSAIWSLSSVRQLLNQNYINGEHNASWLIGDSGYPLEPWLLTPIENADPNTPEGRYTEAHIKARNCIERCFGVLKQRFRCLLKHRILHYDPVKAAKIIYSCAILHNISTRNRVDPLPEDEVIIQDIPEDDENDLPINNPNNNWHQEGVRTRNRVVARHFM